MTKNRPAFFAIPVGKGSLFDRFGSFKRRSRSILYHREQKPTNPIIFFRYKAYILGCRLTSKGRPCLFYPILYFIRSNLAPEGTKLIAFVDEPGWSSPIDWLLFESLRSAGPPN